MELLRTQVDNLQWEINRLDAENRQLRDGDVEASASVDLEDEMERLKAEVAQMAELVSSGWQIAYVPQRRQNNKLREQRNR